MRVLVISDLSRFADSLRAIVLPSGYEVSHATSVEDASKVCAPAATKAVFVYADTADVRMTEKVSRLGVLGYCPVYVALEQHAGEWEERSLLAGAAFVFHLPWRAGLVLSRLQAIPLPPARSSNPPFQTPPPPRGSSSPFGGPGASPWGGNPLLARLHGVAQVFRHASQPDTFADAFLGQIREALALNRVALYLAPEGHGRALECAYVAGIEPKRWKMASFSLDAGMGHWMAEHLVAISIGTMDRYTLEPSVRDEMEGLGAQCAIPIQGGDEFMGILLVGSRVTGYPLTDDEIELVYLLGLELGRTLKAGRLNKTLSHERQFLVDLTEGMGSGCAVFDRDFHALHVNRQMVRLCGVVSSGAFTFRSLPKQLASLAFEVSSGTRAEAETVFADAHGGTQLAKVFVFNEASRAVMVLVDDVSWLTARHTGELETRERELVARLGAQFVHEVRNSLTRLMTLGQMLPEKRKDPEFLDQLEQVLPRDLNRVLRHATNLEILSKPTPPLRKKVAVPWLVGSAWRQVCSDNPDFQPAWLDVEGIPEDTTVFVNAEVFTRACYELLLNAAQALEDVAKKQVTVGAEDVAGSKCRLVFEDSGKGFAEDIKATAISPFVTTRNQGLGLGLTLVEKFSRESSGLLGIEASKRLGGAAVSLTLPNDGQ